ncbi:MAG: sigma 54-interacting transcriptional regulator [Candidatus Eisenbacteria bacterium]|nr:sigma 54-interacting transcriptional regulator [Candidatus Eisenbacteria bacterium]
MTSVRGRGSQREQIISVSDSMKRVLHLVDRIAPTESTVLITGESGTGKEKIARVIHLQSRRAGQAFVAVNASAIPETLIESELFGHVRGAFTDARDRRRGLFEMADKGTIFLDEIGEMAPSVQVKLLRVLQDREIRPAGSDSPLRVDVRVLAATNADLREAMRAGRFREDLFYRLNVFRIHLPPLRERKEEIPFLARYFLRNFTERYESEVAGFSDQTWGYLTNYDWPGNVRELENAVEHAVIVTDGPMILPRDLPPEIVERGLPRLGSGEEESIPDGLSLQEVEARYIRRTLRHEGGSLTKTARTLGVSRTTLWRKMRRYGITAVSD